MQQEITGTLKTIDGEIREFVRVLEKAKACKSLDDKEKRGEELKVLNGKMHSHRAQIRKWIAQLGPKHASKDTLGSARARLEQEMQKFQQFEAELKAKVAEHRRNECSTVSDDSKAKETESNVEPADIKILAEQLVRDDGVDVEMVEEFVCKICQTHVVGCGPKLTSCSHLFCGDCLRKWFAVQPGNKSWAQRAAAKGTVPCPVCKEPLGEQDVHSVCADGEPGSAMLWAMLSEIQVMCSNHSQINAEGKCNWIGSYGEYQEHISSCKNEPVYETKPKPVPKVSEEIPEAIESQTDEAPYREAASPQLKTVDCTVDASDATTCESHSHHSSPKLSDASEVQEDSMEPFEPIDAHETQFSLGGDLAGASEDEQPAERTSPPLADMSLTDLIGALVELQATTATEAPVTEDLHIEDGPALPTPDESSIPEPFVVHARVACNPNRVASKTTLDARAATFQPEASTLKAHTPEKGKPKKGTKAKQQVPADAAAWHAHAIQMQAAQLQAAQMAHLGYAAQWQRAAAAQQAAHWQTAQYARAMQMSNMAQWQAAKAAWEAQQQR